MIYSNKRGGGKMKAAVNIKCLILIAVLIVMSAVLAFREISASSGSPQTEADSAVSAGIFPAEY
jgi:hypothetical protein